jgi:uncharacterized protein YigE (DUF2233 family)
MFWRLAIATGVWLTAAYGQVWAACAAQTYAGNSYTVCSFDVSRENVALYNLGEDGQPYRNFSALEAALKAKGETLEFAMNAGMYDENQRPIGLYVENGKTLKKLNRRDGGGNFHLKPNGVFYVAGRKAGVLDTDTFARRGLTVDYASQSGPMLVVNGQIHPKFSANGTSLKRRNGVGIVGESTLVFAISENPVNFYDFAVFFRDSVGAKNALFLDGSVSSLYSAELSRNDGFLPLGPIVAVVK